MSKKKTRSKPAPISTRLHKEPAPEPGEASAGINDVSHILEPKLNRAEKKIAHLEGQVEALGKQKKVVVQTPESNPPIINMPTRPRIASIKIKYDALGMPSEMVPVYKEA